MLRWFAKRKKKVKRVVLENASENDKLTSPSIEKEIVDVVAEETTKAIVNDLVDQLFAILIDESTDISDKEQMVVILRYVNKYGSIVKQFFSIVHVTTIIIEFNTKSGCFPR